MRGCLRLFLAPPSPGRLFGTILKRNLFRPKSRKLWSSMDTARQLMAPYGEVIKETFENEHLRTAMLWLSAQSGYFCFGKAFHDSGSNFDGDPFSA